MRNSVLGFAVAGATLASAIASALPAYAVVYNYNGSKYDVTTHTGTFQSLIGTLTASDNALWKNKTLAQGLAGVVGLAEGTPNCGPYYCIPPATFAGPYFAYDFLFDENWYVYYRISSYMYTIRQPNNPMVIYDRFTYHEHVRTYATATATAVPWDIQGSAAILGSITGIGLGFTLRQLKNRKDINIKE